MYPMACGSCSWGDRVDPFSPTGAQPVQAAPGLCSVPSQGLRLALGSVLGSSGVKSIGRASLHLRPAAQRTTGEPWGECF